MVPVPVRLSSSALACVLLLGCGPGSLVRDDEAGDTTSEVGEADTTDEGFEPGPEHFEEVEQVEQDLQQIVDGAIEYFLQVEQAPHRCPHGADPTGGESGITPLIDLDCNAGPDARCVPASGGGGAGYYDDAWWTANPVWIGIGFGKTEPHFFHYNFIFMNTEPTDYGKCSFTAQAFADLDDDAIFSTYERRGTIDENGPNLDPMLFVTNPWE